MSMDSQPMEAVLSRAQYEVLAGLGKKYSRGRNNLVQDFCIGVGVGNSTGFELCLLPRRKS